MDARKAAIGGLLIGFGFWIVLVSLSIFLPASNILILPTLPLPVSIALGLVLLPGAAFIGSVAGAVRQHRFLKILGAGFLVYVACAVAAGTFLVLGDPSPYPPDNALWRKLGGSVALGLAGALIFALPFSPFLAIAVFFLERKTRPEA